MENALDDRRTDNFFCFAPGPKIAFPFAVCEENSMLTEWGSSRLQCTILDNKREQKIVFIKEKLIKIVKIIEQPHLPLLSPSKLSVTLKP